MQTNATPTPLQAHIASTYFGLRWGLVVLAVVLPILLPLGAGLAGIAYQGSLSAYYHALGPNGESVRDLFVGLLLVVGALLYLYKGYSRWENGLLNAAGLMVAGVAWWPMPWPPAVPGAGESLAEAAGETASLHGAFAICFFLCIAAACVFCSWKTLALISDAAKRAAYRRGYCLLGALMVLAPISAYVLSFTLAHERAIIAVESVGVLAFGAYWFVKTRELARSNAELNGLAGRLNMPLEPATSPAGEPPLPETA